MGRIQGLNEVFVSGDQLIKTGRGEVHSITLSWSNSAAGQAVTLRDGTDTTATTLVPFVLPAANGTMDRSWIQGKVFTTGLFFDSQGSGQIQAEITYK